MLDQVFYVSGGYSTIDKQWTVFSTIAKYNPDNDTWTKVGDLNTARMYHNVIVSQGVFLVVGNGPTEKCQLEGNSMVCVDQEPNLYYRYGWKHFHYTLSFILTFQPFFLLMWTCSTLTMVSVITISSTLSSTLCLKK